MIDSSTNIYQLAQSASEAKYAQQLQTALLKKSKDVQEQQGEAALKLINSVPVPTAKSGNELNVVV